MIAHPRTDGIDLSDNGELLTTSLEGAGWNPSEPFELIWPPPPGQGINAVSVTILADALNHPERPGVERWGQGWSHTQWQQS